MLKTTFISAKKLPMSIPVTQLKGVGARTAEQLARLEIYTVEELLFHLPMRYEDRTRITPIHFLQAGQLGLVEGRVETVEIKQGKKRVLTCSLHDETGVVVLCFFHFYPSQIKKFQNKPLLRCFGEVREGYHCLEMVHPIYEFVEEIAHSELLEDHLTPIYPSVSNFNQTQWHSIMKQALTVELPELLPTELLQHFNLPSLQQALKTIHQPPPSENLTQIDLTTHPARQRIAFEELLAQHLSLRALHQHAQQHLAPALKLDSESDDNLITRFMRQLAFKLTPAQQKVVNEISHDLMQPKPMQRLLQGDVGSGKTVVAALSALQAIAAGYQVAIMAPTELLAEQHKNTFAQWLEPLDLKVTWLSGSLTQKKRRNALEDLILGITHLAVGTHALFQDTVKFNHLGLVVIDEQHRFGVHQRLALRDKGKQGEIYPHQLIMTATPIPRTLAMTAYADLDVSVIDELPPGRTPVQTAIVPDVKRDKVIQRVYAFCQQGKQVYWVCPLIEESETLQLQAAEDTAQYLTEQMKDLKIGLVHGRMSSKDKELVMQQFKAAKLDVLVATTVIEVGVDVPNASLMVIENAERLGLAQLHQLRGRVGRGAVESYCLLLYQAPLSKIAQQRLTTIRESNDGFFIAQKDLEIRGPGEVLGTRQTGVLNLKVADLEKDKALFEEIPQAGQWLLTHHPQLCEQLIQRWIKKGLRYGAV